MGRNEEFFKEIEEREELIYFAMHKFSPIPESLEREAGRIDVMKNMIKEAAKGGELEDVGNGVFISKYNAGLFIGCLKRIKEDQEENKKYITEEVKEEFNKEKELKAEKAKELKEKFDQLEKRDKEALEAEKEQMQRQAYRQAQERYEKLSLFGKLKAKVTGKGLSSLDGMSTEELDSMYVKGKTM